MCMRSYVNIIVMLFVIYVMVYVEMILKYCLGYLECFVGKYGKNCL